MDTDMGNEAVQAMRALLTGLSQTSERLAATPLDKLKPSPFYNTIADGKPVEQGVDPASLHTAQQGQATSQARYASFPLACKMQLLAIAQF